jgi:hypothetical protein
MRRRKFDPLNGKKWPLHSANLKKRNGVTDHPSYTAAIRYIRCIGIETRIASIGVRYLQARDRALWPEASQRSTKKKPEGRG